MEARIFVQIASYRDPQLGATVRDLIAKALHPERLHIGICCQVDPSDDAVCGPAGLPAAWDLRGATLSLDLVAAQQSGGVCWARARTQRFWREEAFTLQIDSHMRFAQGWDGEMLASWMRCGDPRAVLSVYPNAFELPDRCDTAMLPLMGAHRFDEQGILRLQGVNTFAHPEAIPSAPLPSAFVAAGLLFGPGELIEAVPYDPELYFYGEEISLALRLWTRGFNLYNPDRLLIFHLYKAADTHNTTHWADHADWSERNQRSIQRVLQLLRGDLRTQPFGLGEARSLQQYQQWSGIDFSNRTISAGALAGRFSPAPPASGATTAS